MPKKHNPVSVRSKSHSTEGKGDRCCALTKKAITNDCDKVG